MNVAKNRALLVEELSKNTQCKDIAYKDANLKISWLNQIHSSEVAIIEDNKDIELVQNADAQITRLPNVALAILTADCLPVLISDINGEVVASVHCGWRGLRNNILKNTIEKMQVDTKNLQVWLGPCICPNCYEVGAELRDEFLILSDKFNIAFKESNKDGKFLANLPLIATIQLAQLGVKSIFNSALCTYENKELFYSYRREKITGRICSLIWKMK